MKNALLWASLLTNAVFGLSVFIVVYVCRLTKKKPEVFEAVVKCIREAIAELIAPSKKPNTFADYNRVDCLNEKKGET